MKKYSSLIFILLCTTALFSQKLKINEGTFENLKNIKEYSLVFYYTNLEIPKFDSEEDFLKDKMEKRDDKEEESGEAF